MKTSSDIHDINREFYDSSYKSNNVIGSFIHMIVSYDQQSKSKRNYKVIKKLLDEIKSKSTSVLDYGFGHGTLLFKFPKGVNLYGCEISTEAIKNAKRVFGMFGKTINIVDLDIFNNGSADLKFDVINCSHVLEHLENDTIVVKQFYKNLKPSGKLIINLPINEVWKDPKHIREYDVDSATNLLKNNGFKIDCYQEVDKLTGFFLKLEQTKNRSFIIKKMSRVFRLIFGVAPIIFTDLFGKIFLKNYKYQQIIIVSSKNE